MSKYRQLDNLINTAKRKDCYSPTFLNIEHQIELERKDSEMRIKYLQDVIKKQDATIDRLCETIERQSSLIDPRTKTDSKSLIKSIMKDAELNIQNQFKLLQNEINELNLIVKQQDATIERLRNTPDNHNPPIPF